MHIHKANYTYIESRYLKTRKQLHYTELLSITILAKFTSKARKMKHYFSKQYKTTYIYNQHVYTR